MKIKGSFSLFLTIIGVNTLSANKKENENKGEFYDHIGDQF